MRQWRTVEESIEARLVPKVYPSWVCIFIVSLPQRTTKVLSLKTFLLYVLSWPFPHLLLGHTSSHALSTPVLSLEWISWLQYTANMFNMSFTPPHKRHGLQGCKARKLVRSDFTSIFHQFFFPSRMLSLLKKKKISSRSRFFKKCLLIDLFWLCYMECRILISQPGIKPTPTAMEAWNLNLWATREVPRFVFDMAVCQLEDLNK